MKQLPVADVAVRLLLSALFLVSGAGKLAAVQATQAYMMSYGVPPLLLWPAAALELSAGTPSDRWLVPAAPWARAGRLVPCDGGHLPHGLVGPDAADQFPQKPRDGRRLSPARALRSARAGTGRPPQDALIFFRELAASPVLWARRGLANQRHRRESGFPGTFSSVQRLGCAESSPLHQFAPRFDILPRRETPP